MLLASGFFAFQVYKHIQQIDDDTEPAFMREPEVVETEPTVDELIADADKAYMDDRVDIAQERLEYIVEQFPDVAEGMNKLAFVLAKQDKNEEAEKYYKASLVIDADDDMTHNALAKLYADMGKNIQAQEHYKLALKIDDNYEITWFNYAELMQDLGEKDEAKKMYNKALAIAPDFEPALEALEKLS
jgi:tetratricopeptide (TPR) repeat protein